LRLLHAQEGVIFKNVITLKYEIHRGMQEAYYDYAIQLKADERKTEETKKIEKILLKNIARVHYHCIQTNPL
jgi:hypothetical protein